MSLANRFYDVLVKEQGMIDEEAKIVAPLPVEKDMVTVKLLKFSPKKSLSLINVDVSIILPYALVLDSGVDQYKPGDIVQVIAKHTVGDAINEEWLRMATLYREDKLKQQGIVAEKAPEHTVPAWEKFWERFRVQLYWLEPEVAETKMFFTVPKTECKGKLDMDKLKELCQS